MNYANKRTQQMSIRNINYANKRTTNKYKNNNLC